MKCPHCGKEINAGSLLGSVSSERKAAASRINGKKGGHPKKGAISRVEKVERTYPSMITEGKDFIHIEDNPPKCASPYCPSLQTKAYQRSTGTFWLCDTHKP